MAIRKSPEDRAAQKAERDTAVKKLVDVSMKNIPMIARFGKDPGMRLLNMGYNAPEELLFVDVKSLGLQADDVSSIRKYQRRYLPKPSASNARAIEGAELRSVLRELSGHDVETSVSKVRFRQMPTGGFKVLIERAKQKPLLLS